MNFKCFILREVFKYKKLLDCNYQVIEFSVKIEVYNVENGLDYDFLLSFKSFSFLLDLIFQFLKLFGNKFCIGIFYGVLLNNLVDKDIGRIKDIVIGK